MMPMLTLMHANCLHVLRLPLTVADVSRRDRGIVLEEDEVLALDRVLAGTRA